jgi:bifunctional UDP-N-acetylglucosamine pyrophosphorylase/glucosamine-1-phosphate N-acetyltransferase
MTLSIVILAAGQGKRMHSQVPKVLHKLAGKTLLEHVTTTAHALSPTNPPVVIYGHQGEQVRHAMANLNVTWVEQTEQLGTGHALQQALPYLKNDHRVLVLYGDVPLTSIDTLKEFVKNTPLDALGIITAKLSNPAGLGRIIRNASQHITAVVEEKDATTEQLNIHEINSGIYLVSANDLAKWLPAIQNQNAQKEFYLTDIIKMAVAENKKIHAFQPTTHEEILGVNDRVQLAKLERFHQQQLAEKFMRQGVTIMDPQRFDVRGTLSVGQDVMIDINVLIEGNVIIGNQCVIGPNTILRNVILGDRVEVKANSVIDGAEISADCIIGPFARIRPGTILAAKSHVGNFVEIKNSEIGEGSKVNHLSYIGDSEVGKRVNVGAGTITCNYDGVNKHRTHIGDDAFIGSNTSLVAPVVIGAGATLGAGSTITREAPSNQLTICRAQQRSIENWQRPKKKES